MEGSQGSNYGLRPRSRSNTPYQRLSVDRESNDDQIGRKTPVQRDTPIKQLSATTSKIRTDPIIEEDETASSPHHPHRTRLVTRNLRNRLSTDGSAGTPEPAEDLRKEVTKNLRNRYSIDGSGTPEPDLRRGVTRNLRNRFSTEDSSAVRPLGDQQKEIAQNNINSRYEYERVSSLSNPRYYGETLADVTLSPIGSYRSHSSSYDASGHRSFSPAYSVSSTDSLFVEQALQDVSALVDCDPQNREHLPSRLYKMSGEYWNKYPKTDYTYSTVSKDRVELAPGQIAVPNMSRRSLKHFRIYGPNTSLDEVDEMMIKDNTWFTGTTRKRLVAAESSDDEDASYSRQLAEKNNQWWITSVLTTLMSIIVTTTQSTYRSVFGSTKGYPYTNLPPRKTSALHSTASALAAPFVWIYTKIVSTITSTVTTITETITPNSELRHYTPAFAVVTKERKRRWWPWLMLLLILPIIGYGYYNYPEIMALVENEKEDVTSPAHFQPKVKTDIGLTNRLAALEKWAGTIDAKMKVFEEKISNFDNLDARIEAYSIKYLQQNVIQILSENSKILADKLKLHFENDFMSKNEMETIKIEIYEKLMASWKPEMTEDSIRKIIQEHLAIFEKRQMQTLVERIKEYMKEIKVQKIETGFDEERVKKIVAAILEVYDADKTGLVDYALESAGGQILSTRCTELYQIKTKQYSLLGVPVWWVYTSPRYALTPGAMPAECWAFQGFPGYLVVKTYAVIEVTSFSIEHMSKLLAVDGKIESAPKNFSVYGLHDELDTNPHLFGDYMYDENGTSIQYFPVKYPKTQNIGGIDYPVAFDIIELRIETNYGNPTYTCVYRFRVHGNPLTDIRRATEDSIYDSKV